MSKGRWSIFDADGRKVAQFSGREIDADQNIPAGGEKVSGDYDGAVDYFDGTTVVPRPEIAFPETLSIAVDETWTISDIPTGTGVLTDGLHRGIVDDSTVVLTFTDPGVFNVELRPPFPYRPATCIVTAT